MNSSSGTMAGVNLIFERLEKLVKIDNNNDFMIAVFKQINISNSVELEGENDCYELLNTFLKNIIQEIDILAIEIKNNDGVLISVKNQKILRMCFQLISAFGITSGLIPGLGISLSKRCISAQSLPALKLTDEEKYEILITCIDFLQRSYDIPVLKNIIITFHLTDYLAALIQLSFAPLKKPGVYSNFTMSLEMYTKLNKDRQKYIQLYEYLVNNCFQPMLMKELLVLQNVTDQNCPLFVKRVIAKEMSRRLIMSGGLLSLIRCFIDGQDADTELDWKKIDMICKIITTKHCNMNESEYLKNITSQLKHIFAINNTKYIVTAISCVTTLYEKYDNDEHVRNLVNEVFTTLSYNNLLSKSSFPGTIALTPQEIEHSIQILHACTCMIPAHTPPKLITSNLYLLFLLRIHSSKNEIKVVITNIILKALELIDETDMPEQLKTLLFGQTKLKDLDICIEEYDAGLTIKYANSHMIHPEEKAVMHFVDIFKASESNSLIYKLYDSCLKLFIDINTTRQANNNKNMFNSHDDAKLLSENDEKYIHLLNILYEISASQKIRKVLERNPVTVINFVEFILLHNVNDTNDECKTIALVLLNTILSNVTKTSNFKEKLHSFIPRLQQLAEKDTPYIKILCKESISLLLSEYPKAKESQFEKALTNIFDSLLPVRAHGVIELNKLIDTADPETISKRHYVFCLLQEQLKDSDSYIYLSTINCIASLAVHCTSDVLSVLCKEYLEVSIGHNDSMSEDNKSSELRMKIGDVIVKVTRRLGEMAVVHKTVLLNTVLCACRDEDPLIRASALSNLAEIALILNYKMGSIIFEVLLCIWSIIETDKAIECRRAAVMVISNLIKGLGKEMLLEIKEKLLPIYRTLNRLYKDPNEDSVVCLHAQLALEELNDIVKRILFTELPIEKEFSMLTESKDILFK